MIALLNGRSHFWRHRPSQTFLHDDDSFCCSTVDPSSLHSISIPDRSVSDYAVDVPAGEYELMPCSDDAEFGGQGRIENGQPFFTSPDAEQSPHQRRFPRGCAALPWSAGCSKMH